MNYCVEQTFRFDPPLTADEAKRGIDQILAGLPEAAVSLKGESELVLTLNVRDDVGVRPERVLDYVVVEIDALLDATGWPWGRRETIGLAITQAEGAE
jgi:hypothetical protein